MVRKELFEFEDFDWFPNVIRTGGTNLIQVFHKMLGTSEVLVELIKEANKQYSFDQIVDMGSGSGGPMPEVIEKYNASAEKTLKLILSDLHPNKDLVAQINAKNLAHLSYHSNSVNATEMAKTPKGLKTMIASFHHMNPRVASDILNGAQENKQPILIYEIAKNNVPFIPWLLFLPLSLVLLFVMALFMTPFVRPFRFSQFLFTYILPLIPALYAWDGQMSIQRTYTFDDINSLIKEKDSPNYKWIIDDGKKLDGKKVGYFIMGIPY